MLLLLVSCGGGDDGPSSASTVPDGTTTSTSSTTSTTAALTPEQEVEQAYLHSWDVYAKAARELTVEGLEEAYAGQQLERTRADIQSLIDDRTPVRVSVEHDFEARLVDETTATVRDVYINHSVLLDADTGDPTEPDPNTRVSEIYTLRSFEGTWKVTDIVRESSEPA